jgi:hypothetical protein
MIILFGLCTIVHMPGSKYYFNLFKVQLNPGLSKIILHFATINRKIRITTFFGKIFSEVKNSAESLYNISATVIYGISCIIIFCKELTPLGKNLWVYVHALLTILNAEPHEHWLINYIDTKAKCRHLQKSTCERNWRYSQSWTHLCELLSLQPSLWFNSPPSPPSLCD